MTTRAPRRAIALAAVLVAAGAVVTTISAVELRRPPPRAFSAPFGTVALAPAVTVAPSAAPTTHAQRPAAVQPHDADGTGIPVTLAISRLKVHAKVVPVAAERNEITVPTDPSTVGWWTGGSVPGTTLGSTVVVGHVDSAKFGPGALFHLDDVRRADVITVTTTGGQRQSYRVDALRTVHKSHGLDANTFATDGPARLVLITCGGPFDIRTRSYADNVVVYAAPV